MSGLLRRIRRPGAAPGNGTPEGAAAEPPPEPARPAVPAGVDADELERRPSTRRRGGLRRRARYLRRARELMLRDLGGLIYESRRRGQPAAEALLAQKADRLAAVDAELRELDEHLGTARLETVLREPGIGGSCRVCGELHPSDARFCANCGADLRTRAPATDPTAAGEEPTRPAAPAAGPGPGEPAATSEQPTREERAPASGRHVADYVPTERAS